MDDHLPDTGRPHVWFLNADELAATRAKLDKLQARAVRKGFTGQIALAATPGTRSHHTAGGLPVTVHGFDVTITGEPPRYQGWRFLAAVDVVGDGVVLRYPPGSTATIPNDRVNPGQCDHCRTRRVRRSTMLVANQDTGEILQVGRSCLKDFLGHSINPVFLSIDEVAGELHGGTPAAWDTDSVLAYAIATVQAHGWAPASASEYGRIPTRNRVMLALTGGRGADELRKELAPRLENAPARAPQIRHELLAGLTGDSGYEANLVAVVRADSVDRRHLGLAVSAINAHQRMQADQQRETHRRQAVLKVEHVGSIGQKITLTGTVRTAIRVDGFTPRSPDNMMLIVDCGTAVAKMVTAAAWAYPVQVGDRLTITGTVKAHTEWNGIKQTVLTRPKRHDPARDTHTPPAGSPPRPLQAPVRPPRLDSTREDHRPPASAGNRGSAPPPGDLPRSVATGSMPGRPPCGLAVTDPLDNRILEVPKPGRGAKPCGSSPRPLPGRSLAPRSHSSCGPSATADPTNNTSPGRVLPGGSSPPPL